MAVTIPLISQKYITIRPAKNLKTRSMKQDYTSRDS